MIRGSRLRLAGPEAGMARIGKRLARLLSLPLLSRLAFHIRRMTGGLERGFFIRLFVALGGFVVVAAALLTALEGPHDDVGGIASKFGDSFYWGVTTVLGNGDTGYVTTPGGKLISWLLVLFGVAIVAAITGALVGFMIDILLKEGQGMGAAGYRDHIVVCGWNSTARELISELGGDEYATKIVLLHTGDKNPAGG